MILNLSEHVVEKAHEIAARTEYSVDAVIWEALCILEERVDDIRAHDLERLNALALEENTSGHDHSR